MAARTREDELKELPQWRANKAAWNLVFEPLG
jgi:hypothetical protein